MIQDTHNMLAYALSYAERGWNVFPLHSVSNGRCSCGNADCQKGMGKHPRISQWQDRAATDQAQVNRWWGTWPDANVGIATGQRSGVFVLDVDGPKGRNTLEMWRVDRKWRPATLTARTGRGLHLYFRQDFPGVGNTARKLGDGVDVRGDRGYVVAPPSVHANGQTYAWEDWRSPVADAPEWLHDAVLAGKPVTAGCGADLDAAHVDEDLIQEGSRNSTLFNVGCSLRGKGCGVNELLEKLMNLNDEKCSPPLPTSEVQMIAESAAKYEPNAVVSMTEGLEAPLSKDSPLWWFPLNVNEWCSDQQILCMTDYQLGWYISLMVACWKTGGFLPNDPVKWAKMARAKSKKVFEKEMSAVMEAFEPTADERHVVHRGLRLMWEKKQELVGKKKRGGNAGVVARRQASVKEEAA